MRTLRLWCDRLGGGLRGYGAGPVASALLCAGVVCTPALAQVADRSGAAITSATATPVQVPSLDLVSGQPLVLAGHWFGAVPDSQASASPVSARPAILLLHGCGGALDRQGRLSLRLRDYAGLLTAEGWHVLVLDSFGARGASQICTQKYSTRTITMTQRRRDVLGALAWLGLQPGVDPSRLALLGWSNGASAVLAATNQRQPEVARAQVLPRAAVAFYPGCESDRRSGYVPSAALLLLVGADDDWTPAAPCEALVREVAAGPPAAMDARPSAVPVPRITVYPGAFHGFDSAAPVVLRSDVPNGSHLGAGVHVGGQPAARSASRVRMLEFLRAALL